ncbi:MAG: hypothetical protein Q9207_001460 [Kuettlingeria erythrocarpa]
MIGVLRIHGIGSTKDLSGAPPSLDDGIGSRSDPKVPEPSLFSLRQKQNFPDQENQPTSSPRYELPGHTPGTKNSLVQREKRLEASSRLTSSSSSDSPVELLTNEHGTYEEVKAGFRAAAKEIAMARRQQQTLDQLASMQLDDEPGILRLRQPLVDAVAELGTDPPRPAELAGSSFHNDDGSTASEARTSSSSPPSAVALDEGIAVTTTPQKVSLKCGDRRISAPDMPWAHDDPSTGQRDRVTTPNNTRSRSYIYPSTSPPQQPPPRDNQNRHSTSILAGAHGSSALPSPAAMPPRSSTTDTEKKPADYSCFDELDRLVKELPPRTFRRQLHPKVV